MDTRTPALKAELRGRMRQLRVAQSRDTLEAAGEAIRRRLRGWPLWQSAGVVAAFMALPGEPPTEEMIRDCLEAGKRLCVPAWNAAAERYEFALLAPGAVCRPGRLHVLEPVVKAWLPADAVDLFLTPGLAFDERGGRLGHGGGHYDRMLVTRRPGALCVGLACDFQIVAEVPCDACDVRMDWVVTPARLFRCELPVAAC
ncbi:MAG: 5-formyltetrahydrofolate cyclo-ligase [Kiritimatiellae bacterium]|nr:5-formyltetrahydrofolate cyclo-ligase [Kiritimatiellia bacterium]